MSEDAAFERATALLAAFRSEVAGHYRMIAPLHPVEQHFLPGWLTRASG
jgi:hypothetical protein